MPEPEPIQQHTDRRAITSPANGRLGGRIAGVPQRAPVVMPTPENTAAIIEQAALCVLKGENPYHASPLMRPISNDDRRVLTRFTGITAEEFTVRLATRLRGLADLTADRIHQKLSADQYRPQDLNFLLAVTVDKLRALDGHNAIQGANVSIQVNNFGPESKADIIARLSGEVFDLPPASPSQRMSPLEKPP